jgi:Ribbon-helix-helix protein, copG family
MATKKTPDVADIKVRVPAVVKKSLDDLARREGNSAPSIVRRFIADRLEADKRKPEK